MDFSDPRQRAAFFAIHDDLPREGPGNPASLERALGLVGPLPEHARVLDIGCGPGAQTLELARRLPSASIVAVDLHAPFLQSLESSARAAGVEERIETLEANMHDLAEHFEPQSFDLLWSEGAAYNLGLEVALRTWRPLLTPGGRIALTEPVFLTKTTPAPVREMFAEYPAMQSVEGCRTTVRECDYELLADFVLPEAAWRDDYYAPLAARLDELEEQFPTDSPERLVAAEHRQEIALFDQHCDHYGYCFLIMTPA